MGVNPQDCAPPRYRAFISYSHADAKFAAWLHRKLEGWAPRGQPRLSPIFIDRAELAAGPDLSAQVRDALAGSAALIVVASPAARGSQWVAQEIALFRQLHPDRPVLAALLDGEPGEAFPQGLLFHADQAFEPLAADFRAGHDGKRLGLLKIVAGLTAQPLDRLVQRDAQSRQRRVMAITAGALLLSLILAASLVVALRARAEAERQRGEAEGMVEFMLTDLRDKLKGVGRLDVMGAVNERAMAHYAGESDLDRLPDDMLLRRAKLLQMMGADDLDRSGDANAKAAIRQRAQGEFEEAWRETGALLHRLPNNPSYIFAHAQSEFYLGLLEFTSNRGGQPRDFGKVRRHWETYRTLAHQLAPVSARGDLTATREVAYAEGAMCSLELAAKQDPKLAVDSCQASRNALERLYQSDPNSLNPAIELANQMGWEADALLANENSQEAHDLRRAQVLLTEQIVARFPDDARANKSAMLALIGQAQTLQSLGQHAEAIEAMQRAERYVQRLRQIDPENQDWLDRDAQILAFVAQAKTLKGTHSANN